jgi:hypothetical protein
MVPQDWFIGLCIFCIVSTSLSIAFLMYSSGQIRYYESKFLEYRNLYDDKVADNAVLRDKLEQVKNLVEDNPKKERKK